MAKCYMEMMLHGQMLHGNDAAWNAAAWNDAAWSNGTWGHAARPDGVAIQQGGLLLS